MRKSGAKGLTFGIFNSVEENFDFASYDDDRKTFKTELNTFFPGAMTLTDYVSRVFKALKKLGFTEKNSLPCICTCRDEICYPIKEEFSKYYKSDPFDLSGLGGMLFGGLTAMSAAQSHAPLDKEDKERYIFFAMPHVAIYKNGEIGNCKRKGRVELGHACGALLKFQKELEKCADDGTEVDLKLDYDDMEHSVLKQRLMPKIKKGDVPTLIELTKMSSDVIQEDLERLVEKTVKNLQQNYYCVLTGIQIHGPNDETYIWTTHTLDYVVVGSKRTDLKL